MSRKASGKSRTKQSFTLINVPPPEEIDVKYNLLEENPERTNIVSDMEQQNTVANRIPFVNSHKVFQFQYNANPPPDVHCFHDRHLITGNVIPIPYSCHPMYNETETISFDATHFIQNENFQENILIEVCGYACSFQCAYAYLLEHHKDGIPILKYMYFKSAKMHDPTYFVDIDPAPSWKILKAYGGCYTIDEFRHSFYTFVITEHDFHVCFPYCIPVGHLFERKAIF